MVGGTINMALSKVVISTSLLLHYAVTSPILTIPESPLAAYNVVVTGGGSSGLTAARALGRVRRSALLIESGVFRKAYHQLQLWSRVLMGSSRWCTHSRSA